MATIFSESDFLPGASSGANIFTDDDFMPDPVAPVAPERTWGDTFGDLGRSLAKGSGDIASLIEMISPIGTGGFRLGNALTGGDIPLPPSAGQVTEDLRTEYVGNPILAGAGPGERILNKAVEYLPSALIPGGGALKARTALAAISGLGGGVANEIGLPEAVGAVGLPTAGTLMTAGAKGAYRGIKGLLTPDLASQADDVTRGIINQYTTPGNLAAALQNQPATPFGQHMRTAEQALDPGFALLTKTLEKTIPEAGIKGKALDDMRDLARMKLFAEAQGPTLSPEKTGAVIREGLSEGLDAIGGRVSKAYVNASTASGTIPIQRAKMAVSDAIADEVRRGRSIDPASLSIIDTFKKTPANASVSELQFQRQNIGAMIGDLRVMSNASPEQKTGLRVLSKLFGAIDEAEKIAITPGAQGKTASGAKKGLTKTQQANIQKGRDLRTLQGDLFEDLATGQILRKDRYNRYDIVDSDVLGKAIAGPEEARQVMTALKTRTVANKSIQSKAQVEQAYRSGLMDELKTRATNPMTYEFEPGRFSRSWNKLKPVIDEVLTTKQIKAVDQVRTDLLRAAEMERMVGNASKRQSVTAQHTGAAAFVKEAITLAAKAKTGILGRALGTIGIGSDRALKLQSMVDQTLVEMAFDSSFASKFLAKSPTPKQVESLALEAIARIGRVGAISSGAALDLPETQSREKSPSARAGQQSVSQSSQKSQTFLKSKTFSEVVNNALDRAEGKIMDAPKVVSVEGVTEKAKAADTELGPLVEAVISQESAGKVKAVSNKGAQGLMQLMPETGKELFEKHKDSLPKTASPTKYDPFNPEQNRFLGTEYLKEQLETFKDPRLALAAYNMGPGALRKIMHKLSTRDWDKIAAYLDGRGMYAETVAYVPSILKKMGSVKA